MPCKNTSLIYDAFLGALPAVKPVGLLVTVHYGYDNAVNGMSYRSSVFIRPNEWRRS